MERMAMSQEERDKLEWLKRASDRLISQREAARNIGVSDRWVRKLLKRMKKQGDAVAVHGLRGRASNRKIAAQTQQRTIELLKQPDWHDFGPTFASEQLAKRHGIEVSDETVRQWMIKGGLWKAGVRRIEEAHYWRPRRSAFGELVLTTGRDRWSILSWIRWSMLLRLWPIPASTTGWRVEGQCAIWCG
jgi:transposase